MEGLFIEGRSPNNATVHRTPYSLIKTLEYWYTIGIQTTACQLHNFKVPRSCGGKNKLKSSLLLQRAWQLILCVCVDMLPLFFFLPNAVPCITVKHLQFGLVCPKMFFQKSYSLFRCNWCCRALFRKNRLSPGKLFKQATLVHFSLIILSRTLKFNMLT